MGALAPRPAPSARPSIRPSTHLSVRPSPPWALSNRSVPRDRTAAAPCSSPRALAAAGAPRPVPAPGAPPQPRAPTPVPRGTSCHPAVPPQLGPGLQHGDPNGDSRAPATTRSMMPVQGPCSRGSRRPWSSTSHVTRAVAVALSWPRSVPVPTSGTGPWAPPAPAPPAPPRLGALSRDGRGDGCLWGHRGTSTHGPPQLGFSHVPHSCPRAPWHPPPSLTRSPQPHQTSASPKMPSLTNPSQPYQNPQPQHKDPRAPT